MQQDIWRQNAIARFSDDALAYSEEGGMSFPMTPEKLVKVVKRVFVVSSFENIIIIIMIVMTYELIYDFVLGAFLS